MAAGDPEKSGASKSTVTKDVFGRRNPDTGAKYFERREVEVRSSDDPDNLPSVDQLPPIDPKSREPASLQSHFMDIVDEASEADKEPSD